MNQHDFSHLLVFPHLQVHNANAVSSPLTHGFPSMTAFLGLMWALERRCRQAGMDLDFNAVGVVCHDHDEQVSADFIKRFRLTRNPILRRKERKLVKKDGSADTPSIVEEGRIHLDLSLVLAINTDSWDKAQQPQDLARITETLHTMRVAGGTLLPTRNTWRNQPWIADFTSDDHTDRKERFRELCNRLLPGSTLVCRDDLIDKRLEQLRARQPDATRLDAWLSLSRTNWYYDADADNGKGAWQSDRPKGSGWIVPIPVGYGSLSELHDPGTVANARDEQTPFRFVESLYSVGEWLGPHRLRDPIDMLWYAGGEPDNGLYRCRNDYRPSEAIEPEA